jgi:hypothetical protein
MEGENISSKDVAITAVSQNNAKKEVESAKIEASSGGTITTLPSDQYPRKAEN